ncbi:MAG TPA: hypothetical protein DD381_12810 [Lentisphaeria bacterium]|nr:MAG: hypothetical protein A2X47_12380 [Lentisphaerae bacterium GWF2_38_69]HBM17205.1 hypothetical protein [Lentisphaeria bacterium]
MKNFIKKISQAFKNFNKEIEEATSLAYNNEYFLRINSLRILPKNSIQAQVIAFTDKLQLF